MKTEIKKILEAVRDGSLSVDEALTKLKLGPYEDLGYAKVDLHRPVMQGAAEVEPERRLNRYWAFWTRWRKTA